MGNHSEADNKVLVQRTPIAANHTEDVFYYMSVGKGEVFRCQISIEICCEVALEDRRCDLLVELQEALSKTMVGVFKLTKKAHIAEYHGTIRLEGREPLEES